MNAVMLTAASAAPTITAQIITTIVAFLLVLWTLYAFAWKPIIAAIDARREEISSEYNDIDRKLAEANTLMKDYEERLRRIDDEARERQNKAIDEGRRIAEQLIDKARGESEKITQKAREAMQLEIEQARIDLRREVVEMTLTATGKLLETSVDDQQHRQLVERFVTELEGERA